MNECKNLDADRRDGVDNAWMDFSTSPTVCSCFVRDVAGGDWPCVRCVQRWNARDWSGVCERRRERMWRMVFWEIEGVCGIDCGGVVVRNWRSVCTVCVWSGFDLSVRVDKVFSSVVVDVNNSLSWDMVLKDAIF